MVAEGDDFGPQDFGLQGFGAGASGAALRLASGQWHGTPAGYVRLERIQSQRMLLERLAERTGLTLPG